MDDIIVGTTSTDASSVSVHSANDLSKVHTSLETHCAWCRKPRKHFKVELIPAPRTGSSVDRTPVCCSQICFDQLRRAQFKHRRQANLPCSSLPFLLTSGRPPYIPDPMGVSSPDKYSNTSVLPTSTATMPTHKSQTFHGLRRRIQRQYNCVKSIRSTPVANDCQSHNTPPDDVCDEYVVQAHAKHIISSLINGFPQFGEDVTTHSPNNNSLHNLLNILIGSDALHGSTNRHINPETGVFGAQCSNATTTAESVRLVPIVLPLILPIFKNAPELLQILHRHDYHSRQHCARKNSQVNVSTQTTDSDFLFPLILPAHACEDDVALDLRLPRPETRLCTANGRSTIQCDAENLSRKRKWNCYKMTDIQTGITKLIELTPTGVRRKSRICQKFKTRKYKRTTVQLN